MSYSSMILRAHKSAFSPCAVSVTGLLYVEVSDASKYIEMLIVAEQNRIDRPDLIGLKSRAGELFQLYGASSIMPSAVKGRIGEYAVAIDFDEKGRSADQT